MSEQQKGGGPAFPCTVLTGETRQSKAPGVGNVPLHAAMPGMTLRDYFAAKAMQGILADSTQRQTCGEFATNAYAMADAMLATREA